MKKLFILIPFICMACSSYEEEYNLDSKNNMETAFSDFDDIFTEEDYAYLYAIYDIIQEEYFGKVENASPVILRGPSAWDYLDYVFECMKQAPFQDTIEEYEFFEEFVNWCRDREIDYIVNSYE